MDKRERFYQQIIKSAREHGFEPVRGRELSPEEMREQQEFSKGIYTFLEDYRKFEEESRKIRIVVRSAA